MSKQLTFYEDLTQIAESRIKEMISQVEQIEAYGSALPKASSYFRDCAVCIYLAWCDVTDGWQSNDDLERLEALTNGISWAGQLPSN